MDYSTIILYLTLVLIIGLSLSLVLAKKVPKKKKKKPSSYSSAVLEMQEIHVAHNTFLLQKIDQRKRIIDEYHHTNIVNAQYKLVFQLENGEQVTLKCSKITHKDIPFRKSGELRYCNHTLVRFLTDEQTYSDGYLSEEA